MSPAPRFTPTRPATTTPSPDVQAIAEGIAALARLAELAPRLESVLERLEQAPQPVARGAADDGNAMSVGDLCERAGVSRALIYKRIKAGDLRTVKVGRRTLIPGSVARNFLAGGSPH